MAAPTIRGLGAAIVLTAAGFVAEPAQADRTADVERCLLDHSTRELEDALRDLIVAALSDVEPDQLKQRLDALSTELVRVGINHCELTVADFNEPDVTEALHGFGTVLGEQLMKRAFAVLEGKSI